VIGPPSATPTHPAVSGLSDSGQYVEGTTLSTTVGAFTGEDLTYTYQWSDFVHG
jgi:hypothetical protein